MKAQRRGVKVSVRRCCMVCMKPITHAFDDIIVLFCGHVYHVSCLKDVFNVPKNEQEEEENGENSKRRKRIQVDRFNPASLSQVFGGVRVHCVVCHRAPKREN